jgi:hypothetical protein
LEGILSARGPEGGATFLAVGFSTVQNDKYLEATASKVSFQISPERLEDQLARIDQWRKKSRDLPKQLAKAKLVRSEVTRNAAILSIRPSIEREVSSMVRDLLSGDPEPWEHAASKYRPMMGRIAKSLSPGFTTEAVERRRGIAFVVPDMRPKPEKTKKPIEEEGENM